MKQMLQNQKQRTFNHNINQSTPVSRSSKDSGTNLLQIKTASNKAPGKKQSSILLKQKNLQKKTLTEISLKNEDANTSN